MYTLKPKKLIVGSGATVAKWRAFRGNG